MRDKDIIKLNIKELKRLQIINKVLEKRLKQTEAASLIDLSDRQIRRIVKRVKEQGETGIVHQSRGRSSNRAFSSQTKESSLKFYEKKYHDFGPTLAVEKLQENDGISVNRETLRLWLLKAHLWQKKKKAKQHRQWRQRKEHKGQMLLFDGSHHDWLEGRGPKMVLMAFVDDASGEVFAKFYDYEGTTPALDCLKDYIKSYGIPLSIYLDKHSTYLLNKKLTVEEELQGVKKALTQFQRACKELGIEVIHANSPQAKGRIEREFGTLQDRLVKEMRLASIDNKEQANLFLPDFLKALNRKFSVKPAKIDDLHQQVPAHIDLDKILCKRVIRKLRNDNTVSFDKKLYLIEDKLVAKVITVEVRTDSSIHLSNKGQYLNYKLVEPRHKASLDKPMIKKIRKPYIPPVDHPWRNKVINHKSKGVPCLTK